MYAAYGDYFLIWDTAGNKVAQVAVPPIEVPEGLGTTDPEPTPYEDGTQADGTVTTSKESSSTTSSTTKSMLPPDYYHPKPNIKSMLLTDNHLVAIVTGYRDLYYTQQQQGDAYVSPILYNYRSSQIQLYQKQSNGNLTFVGSKDVNGNFVDARSIGDNVHLATATGVDVWTHLWQPLERYNFEDNITDEEYQVQAVDLAEKLIPVMARKLREELQVDDTSGDLPTMLQVNQWMTTDATESGSDGDGTEPGFDIPFNTYNVISNVAQVTSFNVNTPLAGGELMTSASAYMAPSYFDTLYGTEDHLVLATSGWNWNPTLSEQEQTTYMVALQVDGASTRFLSVGTLKGHLLNQYALDIVGDELRAATTVERNQWWWGRPMPMPMPMMMDDIAVTAVAAQAPGGGGRKLQQEANDKCVGPPEEGNGCSTMESYLQCLEVANAGCEVVVQTLMCPPTFSCADQPGGNDENAATTNPDPNGLCPSIDGVCVNEINRQVCLNLVSDGCVAINQLESCPLQFTCGEYGNDNNIIDADPLGLCRLPTEDCMNENNYQECLDLVRGGCTSISELESCPLTFRCNNDDLDPNALCRLPTEDCMNEDNYQLCLGLVQNGCTSISELESCPLQFECAAFGGNVGGETSTSPPLTPSPTPEPESRTENYMIVLKLEGDNSPGLMSEKGRVQIGEANERITAVRFFDNVAYAVTFERTDPFYVLDMSVPAVLGELKLPGFSSYLHSMNEDNSLLLAVGQDATDDGTVTGLQVTVFDATNPAFPIALVSHTFENDPSASSSSSVEWDYHSFRYIAGKLIIPLEIWYYQTWNEVTQELMPLPDGAENFQGFAVLDISTTSITEQYRISHLKAEGSCSYCNGYVPQRSFVYSGDLMTVRDNLVVSTVLNTGEEVWRLPLSVEGEPAECCW